MKNPFNYVIALEDEAIVDMQKTMSTIKVFDSDIKINKYPGVIVFVRTKLSMRQLQAIKGIRAVMNIPIEKDMMGVRV